MKIEQVYNILGFVDHQSLDIHWESFVSPLQNLRAWIRFMTTDENITPATAEMMNGELDRLFNRYKELWDKIERIVPYDSKEAKDEKENR